MDFLRQAGTDEMIARAVVERAWKIKDERQLAETRFTINATARAIANEIARLLR